MEKNEAEFVETKEGEHIYKCGEKNTFCTEARSDGSCMKKDRLPRLKGHPNDFH